MGIILKSPQSFEKSSFAGFFVPFGTKMVLSMRPCSLPFEVVIWGYLPGF